MKTLRANVLGLFLLLLCCPAIAEFSDSEIRALIASGAFTEATAKIDLALLSASPSKQGFLLALKADILSRQGDPDSAVKLLRRSSELHADPELKADSLMMAGFTMLFALRPEEALALFQETSRSYPGTTAGATSLEWAGDSYRDLGRFSEAQEKFKEAATIWRHRNDIDSLARALHKLANLLLIQERTAEALEVATESVRLKPSLGGYLAAGRAHHRSQDLEQAVKYFRQAVQISAPNSADADYSRAQLGQCLTDLGDLGEALAVFEAIPAKRYPPKRMLVATLFAKLGWTEKLLEQLRLAAEPNSELNPAELEDVRIALLSTLVSQNLMDEADALLATIKSSGSDQYLTETLLQEAIIHRKRGELGLAEVALLKVEQRTSGKLNPGLTIEKARVYSASKQWDRARETLERCREEISKVLGEEHSLMSAALQELGQVKLQLGDKAGAQQDLEAALSHSRRTRGALHLDTAAMSFEIGELYRLIGISQKAEVLLRASTGIFIEKLGSSHPKSIRAKVSLGSLLIGRPGGEGKKLLKEAETELSKLPSSVERPTRALLYLFLSQSENKNPETALAYLEKGLPFANRKSRPIYLLGQASHLLSEQKFAEATEVLSTMVLSTDDTLIKVMGLTTKAMTLRLQNRYEDAFKAGQEAALEAKNAPFPLLKALLGWERASYYLDLKQPENAWKEISKVLEWEKQIVGEPSSLPALEQIQSTAVETLLTMQSSQQALSVADDSLARALEAVVRKQTAGRLAGIPPRYTQRLDEIEASLQDIQNEVEATDPLQLGRRSAVQELLTSQEALQSERRGLLNELNVKYPAYNNLLAAVSLDPSAAQLEMGEKTAILLYFLGPRSFLFLLTSDYLGFVELGPANTINAKAKEYHRDLSRGQTGQRAVVLTPRSEKQGGQFEVRRQELGKLLLEPIQKQNWLPLLKNRRLVVVPTQNLWMVPFETLPGLENSKYLIQERTISYSPSISLLLSFLRSDVSRKGTLKAPVFFGGCQYAEGVSQLPFAEAEVKQVSTEYPNARLYTGPSANEKTYLDGSELAQADLIHFATHGVLGKNPALLLSPTSSSDGRLDMGEILGRPIEARLVTLSACSSGRGWLRPGEGVMGLSRAFLHSGASTVVVSLWNVNDRSTALLMQHFYATLKTTGPAEALRAARLKLIEVGAPPEQWAPFVVIGSP